MGEMARRLAFDNMTQRSWSHGNLESDDRAVRGTTPWKQYNVEIDVDARAENFVFGGLLAGVGTAWFDDLAIEVNGRPLKEELASEPTKEQIISGLSKEYYP